MKKYLLLILLFLTTGCAINKPDFDFPLELSNCSVKTSKSTIEYSYKIDSLRTVFIKKSLSENNNYSRNYPVIKENRLLDDVLTKIYADKSYIYIANFAGSSGYYSIYCPKGLNEKEVLDIYYIIAKAEAPKFE